MPSFDNTFLLDNVKGFSSEILNLYHGFSCPCCSIQSDTDDISIALDDFIPSLSRAPTSDGTLAEMAAYLKSGYWDASGSATKERYFNLGSSGIESNDGVLTYNATNNDLDGDGVNSDWQYLIDESFKYLSAVLGIDFQEDNLSTTADIMFCDNGGFGNGIGAYSSPLSGTTLLGGDLVLATAGIHIAADFSDDAKGPDNTGLGGYSHATVIHEIVHCLGLGHLGNYNNTLDFDTAEFRNDTRLMSTMSYVNPTSNPNNPLYDDAFIATLRAADGLALESRYGAQGDFGTSQAFTGNTTYGFNTTITNEVSAILNQFTKWIGTTANPGKTMGFTIFDGGGVDTLDFSGFSNTQSIDLRPTEKNSTTFYTSDVELKRGNLTFGADTVIENYIGGSGKDTVTGNSANNIIDGGKGDDMLTSGAGDDNLTGGLGADTFESSGGTNTITDFGVGGADKVVIKAGSVLAAAVTANYIAVGGSDIDNNAANSAAVFTVDNGKNFNASAAVNTTNGITITAAGKAAASLLEGTDQDDVIIGGKGGDTLKGDAGNDTISGGEGDDTISGGAGDDNLTGSAGADTFASSDGTNTITDFGVGSAVDKVVIKAGSVLVAAVTGDYVAGAAGDIDNNAAVADAKFTVANDKDFNASAALDTTNGITITAKDNAAASVLVGTNKADVITGGKAGDTLTGSAGDDAIDGQNGADTAIYSGARTDYNFALDGGNLKVFDQRVGAPDGNDTLANIEFINFNGDLNTWADVAALADDTPPIITGLSGEAGDANSSVSINENSTFVGNFSADEAVSWDLIGGADLALFTINTSNGALSFNNAPDFETPKDADSDNRYLLNVRANDISSNAAIQQVSVNVLDVNEVVSGGGGGNVAPTIEEKEPVPATNDQDISRPFAKKIHVPEEFSEGFDSITGLKTNTVLAERVSRLYTAAFARFPDLPGLQYWFDLVSTNTIDIVTAASHFIESKEFSSLNGLENSNSEFIEILYENILGRSPEAAGFLYWNDVLREGLTTRNDVLLSFADSDENIKLFNSLLN